MLYEIGVYDKQTEDFVWEIRLSHGFAKMKKRAFQLAKKYPNCEVLAQPFDKEADCACGGYYSVVFKNGAFKVLNQL